jgi:hypothetical protein
LAQHQKGIWRGPKTATFAEYDRRGAADPTKITVNDSDKRAFVTPLTLWCGQMRCCSYVLCL